MSVWTTILTLVANKQITVADGEQLVLAAIKTFGIISSQQKGKPVDVLAILEKEAPDVIEIVKVVAEIAFPEFAIPIAAASIIANMILVYVEMTPSQKKILSDYMATLGPTKKQEIEAWMDRQNARF